MGSCENPEALVEYTHAAPAAPSSWKPDCDRRHLLLTAFYERDANSLGPPRTPDPPRLPSPGLDPHFTLCLAAPDPTTPPHHQ